MTIINQIKSNQTSSKAMAKGPPRQCENRQTSYYDEERLALKDSGITSKQELGKTLKRRKLQGHGERVGPME